MGCANSKEEATGRSPKRLAPSRTWKKRLLIPIVEGFLQSRNHRAKQASEPLPIEEKVRASQEEEGNQKGLAAMEPEVIDVVALMEGLEEQEEEHEKAACVTMPVTTETRSDGPATPESWTDQDESSSFCEASSPESSRNHCGSPKSPRSPLFFGGSQSQRGLSLKGFKRCGDNNIVVARNFSFNLRSCVDQASTPKVILDSTSPLLSSDESRDFKHRLDIRCTAPTARDNYANDDSDLLSTFESMMEQIRNDDWISSSSPSSEVSSSIKDSTKELPKSSSHRKDVAVDVYSTEPDGYVRAPALFIDKRYMIERLNELKNEGQLHKLSLDPSGGDSKTKASVACCKGCGGASLVPCLDCNGSRRFMADNGLPEGCTGCTVNGMVSCPLCS